MNASLLAADRLSAWLDSVRIFDREAGEGGDRERSSNVGTGSYAMNVKRELSSHIQVLKFCRPCQWSRANDRPEAMLLVFQWN